MEKNFYSEGGGTPAQVAKRGGQCLIPGNIQSQVGWSSEQRGLFEDVLLIAGGVGWGDL